MVADALSRPEDSVQDTLRVSSQPQSHVHLLMEYNEVAALCGVHCKCLDAAESRAVQLVQHVQQAFGGQVSLPMLSALEFQQYQEQDPGISKV